MVWLACNQTCFNQSPVPTPNAIGSKIIALTTYWCKNKFDNFFFKLSLIFPMDVIYLNQACPLIILSYAIDILEKESSRRESDEDPTLGLEGSDLTEHMSLSNTFDMNRVFCCFCYFVILFVRAIIACFGSSSYKDSFLELLVSLLSVIAYFLCLDLVIFVDHYLIVNQLS